MKTPRAAAVLITLCLTPLGALTPSAALGSGQQPVDESRLVPALSPTFVSQGCKTKLTGPVCKGERHLDSDWAPTDLPCAVPIWGARTEDRYQTRYYNHDYLNYYREFRTNDTDSLSTSPTGPATATISTNVRFFETFDIPGDDQTMTVTTVGVIWDLRPAQGPTLFRAVGELVEPYNAPATFSGQVTTGGVSTRYHNAPLDEFFSDDAFVEAMCQAATTDTTP